MRTAAPGLTGDRPFAAALRVAAAGTLAAAITLGLFVGMEALIGGGDPRLGADRDRAFLDFVRVEREETVKRRKVQPEKPPAPEPPPAQPAAPTLQSTKPQVSRVDIARVPVTTNIDMSHGGFSLGLGEGEYLPVVKVAPVYPRRALSRSVEGHCTVRFTVGTDGSVRDVEVVEDDCTSSLFERASVEAASKFKYRPRVVGGEPVEVTGVRNRFVFRIER